MKILYIAHRIPYPPNKGDKIRSFNEIKHLAQRHEIHLCCLADDSKDIQHSDSLKTFCKSVTIVPINPTVAKLKSAFYLFSKRALTLPYFYSHKLQQRIEHLLATIGFDCIFCFSSPMAEYIFRSRRPEIGNGKRETGNTKLESGKLQLTTSNPQPTTYNQQPATRNSEIRVPHSKLPILVMDFVDVDSDKWLQYAQYEIWPLSWIHRMEGKRLAAYEKKIAEHFDHAVFISNNEVAIFKSFCLQATNLAVIPNGVDYEYFSPASPATRNPQLATRNSQPATHNQQQATTGEDPILLFTGAMDYYPNIDGVTRFSQEILPRIKDVFPTIQFYIVGSKPHSKVFHLQKNKSIHVTGFVEDIRPYYQAADICVVPLRLARGLQNKVLEAMAMGKPVVATSQALQGIEACAGEHLLVSDDPEDFAANVIDLLRSEEARAELGRKSRDWVIKNYQWSSHMNTLEELIQRSG